MVIEFEPDKISDLITESQPNLDPNLKPQLQIRKNEKTLYTDSD
jgi:hypothetical protein